MTRQPHALRGLLLAACVLLTACSSGAAAPSGGPSAAGASAAATVPASTCESPLQSAGAYTMTACQIGSPALAGNMIGDSPVMSAFVLLPADYDTSGKRYPVVYVLAGFGESGIDLARGISGISAADAGAAAPIVAVVSGRNGLGGSFYVNSSVTGNWEDAVTKDVVSYVDANYRTIAKRESRGISGASMGGFGALNLAMLHPELFSAVFGEVPGLFDKNGATARLYDEQVIGDILTLEKGIKGQVLGERVRNIRYEAGANGEDEQFAVAYGAAFAPDPAADLLMEFPFSKQADQLVRDDVHWAKWEAGFGNLAAKTEQYKANWLQYKGIAIDWGTRDGYTWIPKGCEYFVSLMRDAGIPVTATSFEGTHYDQVIDRLNAHMLPFMEGLLATA